MVKEVTITLNDPSHLYDYSIIELTVAKARIDYRLNRYYKAKTLLLRRSFDKSVKENKESVFFDNRDMPLSIVEQMLEHWEMKYY